MPDEKLTPVQRSVILILMAEAREVPNARLTNEYRCELKKRPREQLVEQNLITARQDRQRRYYLELAEEGWRWCRAQCGEPVPPGSGHGGGAAYALLANAARGAARVGLSLPEFFARDEPVTAPVDEPAARGAEPAARLGEPVDLEARIRKAYHELAARPAGWVRLADLRPLLGEVPRADVDRTLVRLYGAADVDLVPESNQKALSEQDRAAAVWIGNQEKHLLAIGAA